MKIYLKMLADGGCMFVDDNGNEIKTYVLHVARVKARRSNAPFIDWMWKLDFPNIDIASVDLDEFNHDVAIWREIFPEAEITVGGWFIVP